MPIHPFGRKTSRYRSRVNRPEKCQQPISVLSLGLHSESSVGIDRFRPSAGRIWPNHRLPVRPPVDLYRVTRWYKHPVGYYRLDFGAEEEIIPVISFLHDCFFQRDEIVVEAVWPGT